jgi:mono/diheme cytochrome c family protein
MKKINWLRMSLAILFLGIALAVLLLSLFGDELFPESSPAQEGAEVAVRAGCFSCHGKESGQGSVNPSRNSSPADFPRIPSMFERRHAPETLREWIEEGVSSERRQSRAYVETRRQRLLQMPAFRHHLSSGEIEDLMAFLALRQYSVSDQSEKTLSLGEQLAQRSGCFTCHGELGQGGVRNPGSLKGYIPGFFGQDFRALTRNGNLKDVIEWIENGASEAFLNQGFLGFYPGRFFSQRQVIQMPAYKELLQPHEIEIMAKFVLDLFSQGPMTAEQLHQYRPVSPEQNAAQPVEAKNIDPTNSDDRLFHKAASILRSHCLECHGPEKQRSGYRLDSRVSALAGGEIAEFLEKDAIVPGNSQEGLLIQFTEALEEDLVNEVYPMPPADKPRLSDDEIQILKSWIDQGAPWPDGYRLTTDSP